MTDHHPESLPSLRAELVRAIRDHDRARRQGRSLNAGLARERMQAFAAAMTALLLDDLVEVLSTQPAIDFDEAVAEAQRLTTQEAS